MVSKTVDIDGPVHYYDFGGSGPPLVCVHGLGGAALNWMAVGHGLAQGSQALGARTRPAPPTPSARRCSPIQRFPGGGGAVSTAWSGATSASCWCRGWPSGSF